MAQTALRLKPRPQPQSGRYDIYAQIHKGLRSFMADTLYRIGRLDAADELELAEGAAQLRGLLALCRVHLEKENEFLHTAMEARRPGSAAQAAGDHVHHERSLEALEAELAALERSLVSLLGLSVWQIFQNNIPGWLFLGLAILLTNGFLLITIGFLGVVFARSKTIAEQKILT